MFAKLLSGLVRLFVTGLCFISCNAQPETTVGSFEKLDDGFDAVIGKSASIQVIADSLDWSEGPLWLEKEQMLLFSDIPPNIVYKWTADRGKEVYLTPSGYTSDVKRGGEVGSNGLALNERGELVLCQHGDRRIAKMNPPINQPAPVFTTLVDNYQGKKFDSPNDIVFDKKGNFYFTDPPYGLERLTEDTNKQAPYQGVYRVTNGVAHLLVDSITRPNGIAFTPDFKTLIIANSDPDKPIWYAFDITPADSLTNARVFFDARSAAFAQKGGGDGLKIDSRGYVFATGPGGVWIFNSNARLLGRIKVSEAVSNCAFADDEKTLFVTADRYVLKVKLRD